MRQNCAAGRLLIKVRPCLGPIKEIARDDHQIRLRGIDCINHFLQMLYPVVHAQMNIAEQNYAALASAVSRDDSVMDRLYQAGIDHAIEKDHGGGQHRTAKPHRIPRAPRGRPIVPRRPESEMPAG